MSFSHSLSCSGWLPAVSFNNDRLIIITGLLKEHRIILTQWLESLWMSGMEAYDIYEILLFYMNTFIHIWSHILIAYNIKTVKHVPAAKCISGN